MVPLTQVPALGLTEDPSGWPCARVQEGPGRRSQGREARGHSSSCHTGRAKEAERLTLPASSGEQPKQGSQRKGSMPRGKRAQDRVP